jgi:hypothetical protein
MPGRLLAGHGRPALAFSSLVGLVALGRSAADVFGAARAPTGAIRAAGARRRTVARTA